MVYSGLMNILLMVQEVPISVFPFSPHAEQQARVFTHKGKKGCTRGLLKDRGSIKYVNVAAKTAAF